jgi:hypothetical protein
MRRIVLALALSAIATTGVFAGGAAASGPAPPGKEVIEIECGGEPLTVSVARPESSKGAGQIVGAKGHGIPVTFLFTLTDLTSGEVLSSEAGATGNGHGHPNQSTTKCTATFFEGPASAFFEGHEPPGVEPGDLIRAAFEAQVIVKH